MEGNVKSFSDYKGYGFIIGKDDVEYFAHVSKIADTGYKTLDTNDKVIFEPRRNFKGNYAVDIRTIKKATHSEEITQSFLLKKNPFTPQFPISDATKFAGRKEIVFNAIDSLYNDKNILITGARGIGKSSLAYQLLYTTSGESDLLRRIGIYEDVGFNNVICDHRCMFGNSLMDISSGMINTLLSNLNVDITSSTQTIGIDLKFVNFSHSEEEKEIAVSDIASSFATQVEKIYREYASGKNGITFLIDEIDTLDSDVDIASFVKVITEKFRLDSFNSFYMIISGVTGTITDLIAQHQSASRLFEIVHLDKLTIAEATEIVELHLKDTNVQIDPVALSALIKHSNDFPQPIHLIGYHAYRIDKDNRIDMDDIDQAISYIVQNLKRQEYEIKFNTLGKGKNLIALRRIVHAPYPSVALNYIIQSNELTYDEASGVIGELMRQGIVEKVFRSQYRLCEPLFAIYLKMIFDF